MSKSNNIASQLFLSRIRFTNFILLIMLSLLGLTAQADFEYLDDEDKHSPLPSPQLDRYQWPRIMMSEVKNLRGDEDQYTKYPIIAVPGPHTHKAASIIQRAKQQGHDTLFLRMITPVETQEYLFNGNGNCSQSKAIPFEDSADATRTEDCTVYPGHWLYRTGSTLNQAISETDMTFTVADISKFDANRFIVIYSPPLGSFNNAEHVFVKSIDAANNTITVGSPPNESNNNGRGFKSTALSHPAESIVAQHIVFGSRGAPIEQKWTYNMSSECPQDAQGNTLIEVMAEFIGNNFDKGPLGNNIDADVAGILFDVDSNYLRPFLDIDTNNDSQLDDGIAPTGKNWWGAGTDTFYSLVRQQLPNKIIVGGAPGAQGYSWLNGNQEEGWVGWFRSDPDYTHLDQLLAKNSFGAHRYTKAPILNNNQFKQSSQLYPNPARNPQPTNAGFRLGLALAMLDSGFFATENSHLHPDHWYDEYSVDTVAGSSTFGQAIPINASLDDLRNHQGWMGSPTGPRKRIFDPNLFTPALSLVPNGAFESGINGWSGNNVRISHVTNVTQDGVGALRITPHVNFDRDMETTYISGPEIHLVGGKEYTLPLSIRSSRIREIGVMLHEEGVSDDDQLFGQTFIVPINEWARRVYTFRVPDNKTGNYELRINVGRESTDLWVDSVYLFEGNANVFRRDFEKGIVVANATASNRTIDLGGTFQRIAGTQDAVNDGSTLSSVTLPPYDAALLIRPPSNDGSDVECGSPTFIRREDRGIYLWQQCGTELWHARFTAGGSSTVFLNPGTVTSTANFIRAMPFNLESSDRFSVSGSIIRYFTKVVGAGIDGFMFRPASGAQVCFGKGMHAGTQVTIGASNKTFDVPVDLTTFQPCG